jgi:hypothetical protein
MTSWAAHAPAEHAPVAPSRAPRPRPRPASRPQQRRRPQATHQRKVASGVVWIAVFGALLAGVVAINVAVLRKNVQLSELTQERSALRSSISDTSSRLAAQRSNSLVQRGANRAGFVQVPAGDTGYLELPRNAK